VRKPSTLATLIATGAAAFGAGTIPALASGAATDTTTGTTTTAATTTTTTTTTTTAAQAPAATTGGASQLTATGAELNGVVNPEGHSTTYFFQYGPTTGYGLQTPPAIAGSGTGAVAVQRQISALTANGTYHYRLVAQSSAGTTYGADQTLSLAPTPSRVTFMGHMGFVSPGDVIGVEAGCFGGSSPCVGHVTMSVAGTNTVIGQRDFSIPADSGGFQNIKISPYGASLLKRNGVWKLMQVEVDVTTTAGQTISEPMSLARWVWH
jgi:hypothetical protein